MWTLQGNSIVTHTLQARNKTMTSNKNATENGILVGTVEADEDDEAGSTDNDEDTRYMHEISGTDNDQDDVEMDVTQYPYTCARCGKGWQRNWLNHHLRKNERGEDRCKGKRQ